MNIRSRVVAPCVAIAIALTSGCATVESGTDFDMTKAQAFTKGKTTKAEVISVMGAPASTGGNADGTTISYSYMHSGARNVLLGAYGIGSMKSETAYKSCQFSFDRAEKLKDYTCSEGAPSGSSSPFGQ